MSIGRAEADRMWRDGDLRQLGRVLTDGRDPEALVAWARDLLDLSMQSIEPPRSVKAVAALVADLNRWPQGKKAFEAVRQDTLAAERSPEVADANRAFLILAENTAKLAYNATDPAGPFDPDTASWIPQNVRDLATDLGPDYERPALDILFQVCD